MRRALVVGIVLAAGVAAAGVALLVRGGAETLPQLNNRGVAAATFVEPRQHLFGDEVTARVEVLLDRRRVDPATVTVRSGFEPYQPVAPMRTERLDSGRLTRLRFTTRLRCLEEECLFLTIRPAFAFGPAAVLADGRRLDEVEWPRIAMASRVAQSRRPDSGPAVTGLWRANVAELPAPTYRVAPPTALVLLAVLAGLLVAAAVALLGAAVRPAPARPPWLPPLERALALLQAARESAGPQEERKALDLLAVELERHGERDLAREASELAWARLRPASEATGRLADRVGELVAARNGRRA